MLNRTHAARNGITRSTLLIAAGVTLLVAVIIITGIQEAKRKVPAAVADPGPDTLSTGYILRPFSAKDLNGQTVDNTFFAKHRLTMVNVWGTFCGPCIREMPDLAQLPAEFHSRDFAILGVVADTPNTENEATARNLTASTKVTYTNVIPDESITAELLADVSVVPTTFFVDSTGKVVGKILTGSHSKAEWMSIIQDTLASLSKGS